MILQVQTRSDLSDPAVWGPLVGSVAGVLAAIAAAAAAWFAWDTAKTTKQSLITDQKRRLSAEVSASIAPDDGKRFVLSIRNRGLSAAWDVKVTLDDPESHWRWPNAPGLAGCWSQPTLAPEEVGTELLDKEYIYEYDLALVIEWNDETGERKTKPVRLRV